MNSDYIDTTATETRQSGSVGIFFNGTLEQRPDEAIMGSQIASEAFVKAFIKYGILNRYDFFAAPFREDAVSHELEDYLQKEHIAPEKVRIYGYGALTGKGDGHNYTVLHEAGPRFQRPYNLRGMHADMRCPITFTHHTFSYADMLHYWFLPLLLADSQEYDAIICTSQAAKIGISTILNHTASRFEAQFGAGLKFRGRFELIPIGVDTDLFRPRDKVSVRQQLDLPAGAFVILSFGRFSVADKMDLLPLLRVFQHLVRDNPHRTLVLVLAGTQRGGYAQVVANYTATLGIERNVVLRPAPTEDRHLLFAAADVFVSPADNIQEAFGLTPIEAMACGVPQVVADWNGYRDTVVHEVTGYRVPTYWLKCDEDLCSGAKLMPFDFDHLSLAQSVVVDPKIYAQYLQALIDHNSVRQAMAAASREHALKHYSWPVIVHRYETYWQELAEIAAKAPSIRYPTADYARPNYFEAFQHYATQILPLQSRIRLTPAGRAVIQGREVLPTYPGFTETLNPTVLLRCLLRIQKPRQTTIPSPGILIDEIAMAISADLQLHADFVRRHIMWLMKYGFLELDADLPHSAA